MAPERGSSARASRCTACMEVPLPPRLSWIPACAGIPALTEDERAIAGTGGEIPCTTAGTGPLTVAGSEVGSCPTAASGACGVPVPASSLALQSGDARFSGRGNLDGDGATARGRVGCDAGVRVPRQHARCGETETPGLRGAEQCDRRRHGIDERGASTTWRFRDAGPRGRPRPAGSRGEPRGCARQHARCRRSGERSPPGRRSGPRTSERCRTPTRRRTGRALRRRLRPMPSDHRLRTRCPVDEDPRDRLRPSTSRPPTPPDAGNPRCGPNRRGSERHGRRRGGRGLRGMGAPLGRQRPDGPRPAVRCRRRAPASPSPPPPRVRARHRARSFGSSPGRRPAPDVSRSSAASRPYPANGSAGPAERAGSIPLPRRRRAAMTRPRPGLAIPRSACRSTPGPATVHRAPPRRRRARSRRGPAG